MKNKIILSLWITILVVNYITSPLNNEIILFNKYWWAIIFNILCQFITTIYVIHYGTKVIKETAKEIKND